MESIQPQVLLGCSDLFDLLEDERAKNKRLPSGLRLIFSKLAGCNRKRRIMSENNIILAAEITPILQETAKHQSWDEFCTFESSGVQEFSGSNAEERQQQNAAVWEQFERTIQKRKDGYYVRLPWKENANTLPPNKGMAILRLQSTINKLATNKTLFQRYHETIIQQLNHGIIEEVKETNSLANQNNEIIHYLPHQALEQLKQKSTILQTTTTTTGELLDWKRINHLTIAKRTIAYVLRFISKIVSKMDIDLRERIQYNITEARLIKSEPYITAKEYELALRILIRNHQATYYLTYSQKLLRNLNIYQDDYGILRCKGRLSNADIPIETQRPILIIPNTPLAEKLLKEAHLPYHCSISQTIATVRKQFWIPRLRQMVRRAIRECLPCQKMNNLPYKYPNMEDLPKTRVTHTQPFQN
ncbi:hypothetical protein DICVIV_06367, partial [Dictyocaulus viviparus]